MKVNYSYLPQQFKEVDEYFDDLRELVRTGEFTLGPFVTAFEKKFAEYIGVKHVISTNTGTDALILCLKALGIKAGDEVITVPNSFYATVGAIVAVGATPVFVDSDERYNIDPKLIPAAITTKTKAILPVHWAGCPADMHAIRAIAKEHKLFVVEDACPATGATIDGKKVGTFGDCNAFSMHPLKPLNVWGDGGMVTTDDDALAEYLLQYRNHGMVDRDTITMWGINSRLQPFQAIVGSRQLDCMETIIEKRIANARLLDAGLAHLKHVVQVPERPSNMREVYQLYLASFAKRDSLLAYLHAKDIEAKIHYPVPLHLQAPGRALGYSEGDFPVTEKQAKEIITLPSHQHLDEEHMQYILATITEFYERG